MKKKNNEKLILSKETYEVNVSAFLRPFKNTSKSYKDTVLWGYKKGIDFLFDLIWLFKNEMDEVVSKDEKKTISDLIFNVLMSGFRSEFEEKGDLEEKLIKYINGLKKYKFTVKKEGSYRGAPDFKEIEITIDQIKDMLYELRNHKIQFYEAVLKEYRQKKNEYNKKFKEYLESKVVVKGKDAYLG